MRWREEIIELHRFFEDYFLGREASLDRAEAAFHPHFTYVGPNGQSADRVETLEMLRQGHNHTAALEITTADHRLLHATDNVIVASYIERHQLSTGSNERLSTVVFLADPDAPNGVRWLRTHESWLHRSAEEP